MLPSPVTLSYTPDIVYNSLLSLKWSVIIIYFYDYPRLLYFKDATTFRCYIYYHNVSNIRLLLVDVFVCVCVKARHSTCQLLDQNLIRMNSRTCINIF